MSAAAARLLARIGRWPRRIAALVCLLLAAGTALAPHPAARPVAARQGVGAGLRAGEVAVPVPIASAGVGGYVRSGDRVGILAGPSGSTEPVLVADGLRVMSVHSDSGGWSDASGALVVVAASRADALRLARYLWATLLLIVDQLP